MNPEASEPISRIVLRELIRTPAFKQLIKAHLAPTQADPEKAVSELVFEDVEFSASLAVAAASNATDLARSLAQLGQTMEGLPDPVLAALADKTIEQLEAEPFAQAAAVWWRLFERLVLADPERRQRLDASAAKLVESALVRGGQILAGQPALARALLGFAGRVVWTALGSALPSVFSR